VTALQRYLAEEIATDHVGGLLTRRAAMRRLAPLGMGAAAAGELIAACAKREDAADSPKPTAIESPTGAAQPRGHRAGCRGVGAGGHFTHDLNSGVAELKGQSGLRRDP
jgi:carboxymethylenebutenolidase